MPSEKKPIVQKIKRLADLTIKKEYMTLRAIRLARVSSILNILLAAGKIGLGIYSFSLFICINGLYNIGIALAKHTAIRINVKNESEAALKAYHRVGFIIFTTSLLYMAYCTDMAVRGVEHGSYDKVTSIGIAAVTFTEIGAALYGILRTRKSNNLTVMAAKRISLVTALISLVLTESALLGLENTPNAARYSGWTGLIFSALSVIIGLLMMLRQREKTDR
ncbi:hypothetical protein [Lactovum odontotermitis]